MKPLLFHPWLTDCVCLSLIKLPVARHICYIPGPAATSCLEFRTFTVAQGQIVEGNEGGGGVWGEAPCCYVECSNRPHPSLSTLCLTWYAIFCKSFTYFSSMHEGWIFVHVSIVGQKRHKILVIFIVRCHTLHCEARAYVQCRYTSWSYATPVSANAAHFFAHGTIHLLYSQQTGFGYLSEWLLVGFLNNSTKWINVLVMGFVKTLFQLNRLFSVERYVVFNRWHSEWRHCHCSHIHGPISDAVSMSHRRASNDMVINHLTPNGHFSGRTTTLTYRCSIFLFIHQIYVLDILNMHILRFFLFKMSFIS
jgi:hypothetical protein